MTQARNSFPRTSGYNQWVLGVPDLRLPGSLLQDGEAERLEVLEACEGPGSIMAKTVGIREAARVVQVMQDTDSCVCRALLHQSTLQQEAHIQLGAMSTSTDFKLHLAQIKLFDGLDQHV